MNLALEYMLRTGELKRNLGFPHSFFANAYETNRRLVVTIHESFKSIRPGFIVKHWLIDECKPQEKVPRFIEYEIKSDDLFTSDKTVVPGHFLLWYREEPYEAGRQQHADMPVAAEDDLEYRSALNNFLDSKRHRQARLDWLWRAFSAVYGVETKGYVSTKNGTHHIGILKQFYPNLVNYWIRWRRYMLDYPNNRNGHVAGELLFHKEYADLGKLEGRLPTDTNHETSLTKTISEQTYQKRYHSYSSVLSPWQHTYVQWPIISTSV